MSFLLEMTRDYDRYGGAGAFLNIVCGIAAALIAEKKGHGTGQALLYLIFGVFCCGILALISALTLEDKKIQQQLSQLQQANNERLRRIQAQARRNARNAPSSGSFFQCPRCGAQNGEAQGACWQCEMPFALGKLEEVTPPPAASYGKRLPVKDAPPAALDNPRQVPVTPSMASKIRCVKCGKRYSGTPTQLATLKVCPQCKASPFLTEPA